MKGKVLIIDDEFELCLLLKLHLAGKDYDVEMAYNLKDGLRKLDSYDPDIIFLDNNLPDGHGWECINKIVDTHPAIKINLISGADPDIPKIEGKKNLCIMEKPLSKTEIDKCLSYLE